MLFWGWWISGQGGHGTLRAEPEGPGEQGWASAGFQSPRAWLQRAGAPTSISTPTWLKATVPRPRGPALPPSGRPGKPTLSKVPGLSAPGANAQIPGHLLALEAAGNQSGRSDCWFCCQDRCWWPSLGDTPAAQGWETLAQVCMPGTPTGCAQQSGC